MGMTIDEIIDDLSELIICGVFPYTRRSLRGGGYKIITKQSLKEAINIIWKYQKIEEIVNSWNDMNSFDSMVQISEVLEDGR